MRFLSPTVSCILISNMKPIFVDEAIQSVLNQTRKDFQILLVDSGKWARESEKNDISSQMQLIYQKHKDNPFIEWIFTGEKNDENTRTCMFSWVMNRILNDNYIKGEYIFILNDDDVIYPQYVEKMAGYLDDNPGIDAVYCAENRVIIERNGDKRNVGVIEAKDVKTGTSFDCSVDYLQVMFRKRILSKLSQPYWEETRSECNHCDGIFLNRIGNICSVYPINLTLCENRRTIQSMTDPVK